MDEDNGRQIRVRPGRHMDIVQLDAVHLDEFADGGIGFLNPRRAHPRQDKKHKQNCDQERKQGQ